MEQDTLDFSVCACFVKCSIYFEVNIPMQASIHQEVNMKSVKENIIHAFNGCEWNSFFIQSEAGAVPRGLAQGDWFLSRVELKSYSIHNQ